MLSPKVTKLPVGLVGFALFRVWETLVAKMENLMSNWHNLSLNDREGGKLAVKKDRASHEYTLVAKFLTKRVLNTDAVIRTFSPLWRTRNGFKAFGRSTKLDNAVPVHEMPLNTVSLWVQVHHILSGFLSRGVAEDLCDIMGIVDLSLTDVEVDRGSFFRVRVRVDISLPLCRGRVLSIEDSEEHWVTFKYERLPNICYWCGCLDHSDKDCDRWIESEGTLKESDRVYGVWIRATYILASRKAVVVVPGFYEDRKVKMSKSSKPVTGKHSSPMKGNRANITKEG
ncbi:hypothetical protein SO802_021672 [Lithocarpus litseifolius]|uniref:Zinc knuckle CX2CX4HX4C domain-containing protein n=1 Tax=Lithocarpus litseifolius TaxID=425828 RepID=A0AAW2CGV3_9ROSI